MIKFGQYTIKKIMYGGKEVKIIQDANGILYNRQPELGYTTTYSENEVTKKS